MDTPEEKRASPRTDLHQVVRFERTASESGLMEEEPTQGVGRDISPEGASLLTDCALQPGEILKLHVPIEAERASVPVISQVRWTQRTRNGFRVGLQFLA
ncbi:PilZ domain-containing protein [Geothrix edaphica]|uniref:PilZ domain-containing protein n=1 Tax=Geothrix edaphica TaxID=2927976 RepID=A0ABQ5PXQ5_9BACT|nr:PilZ domain-containing protein [Geothrix edaphica]GLH67141.1 hypothetical protein GETHED_15050 [Geothrix edaphica]